MKLAFMAPNFKEEVAINSTMITAATCFVGLKAITILTTIEA